MSIQYKAVGWNRQKRVYDYTLLAIVLLALSLFGAVTVAVHPATTAETFIIRFTSVAAVLLLHVILAVGPLARLDKRFLPVLYNRRHLGVTMAFLALIHAVFAVVQFHAFGDANPIVSVFTAYDREYTESLSGLRSISRFPFEIFGFGALFILMLMAVTSHDFWLRTLGASIWKGLHQMVYLAYLLIVAHVLLGALQSERNSVYPVLLGAGFLVLLILHLLAWRQERRIDRQRNALESDGFAAVTNIDELSETGGRVVVVQGRRFALYVLNEKLYAVSNVCRHQGGPIGEGRMVNGCITCPWHGYQYRADDGCSPPPFTEVLPTYRVRIVRGTVYLNPSPLPLGTKSEGEPVAGPTQPETAPFYIGWQSKCPPALSAFLRRTAFALAVVTPCLAGTIVWAQDRVDRGGFEFGKVTAFEGIFFENPIPRLYDPKTGFSYAIVGGGKFGAPGVVRGANGHRVRLEGSLIVREPMRMVELNRPETFSILDSDAASAPPPPISVLGEGRFVGELVDTKCYFGVMRPATGKIHRGCAVRCLSGGVPPGLLLKDRSGDGVVFLLAGRGSEPLRYDIQLAGTTVSVDGSLELEGEVPILRVKSLQPAR